MTALESSLPSSGPRRPRLLRPSVLVRGFGVVTALPLLIGVGSDIGLMRALLVSGVQVKGVVVWTRGMGGIGLILLSVAVYLLFWLWAWPGRSRLRAALLVAAMIVFAGIEAAAGNGLVPGDYLWIYAALMAGCGLPLAQGLPAIALIGLITLIAPGSAVVGASGVHVQGNVSPALRQAVTALMAPQVELLTASATALPVLVVGGAAAGITFLARTNAELRVARMLLARAAVDEERARLSRDLHDVLGHNLSLIALKAELASRLLDRPEHPASTELDDLKLLARSALGDLREVVGGARLPTLGGELDGARIAAEAAAIDLSVDDRRPSALTPEVEAVCAWIVREGMTNVVKHSGATRCRLRIEQVEGGVSVTVADDGRGGTGTGRGAGLRGLGERIGAAGGQLLVQPHDGAMGGFQLAARLPLDLGTPIP